MAFAHLFCLFVTYRIRRHRAYAIRPNNTVTLIMNWDNKHYQGNHKGCPNNEYAIRNEKSVIKISECIVNNRRNCVGRSFHYSVVGFQRTVYAARTGDPCGRPKMKQSPQMEQSPQTVWLQPIPFAACTGEWHSPIFLPIYNVPRSPI